MYFCKLIIKCIVYDRLRKYSRQRLKKQGGNYLPCTEKYNRELFEI